VKFIPPQKDALQTIRLPLPAKNRRCKIHLPQKHAVKITQGLKTTIVCNFTDIVLGREQKLTGFVDAQIVKVIREGGARGFLEELAEIAFRHKD
jgi:hypothetical protein